MAEAVFPPSSSKECLVRLESGGRPGQHSLLDQAKSFADRQRLFHASQFIFLGQLRGFGLIQLLAHSQFLGKLIDCFAANVKWQSVPDSKRADALGPMRKPSPRLRQLTAPRRRTARLGKRFDSDAPAGEPFQISQLALFCKFSIKSVVLRLPANFSRVLRLSQPLRYRPERTRRHLGPRPRLRERGHGVRRASLSIAQVHAGI